MKITLPYPFCSCEACWGRNPRCQQVGSVVTHWQQEPGQHGSTYWLGISRLTVRACDWVPDSQKLLPEPRNNSRIVKTSWFTVTTIMFAVCAQLQAAVTAAAAAALSAQWWIPSEGCSRLQHPKATAGGQWRVEAATRRVFLFVFKGVEVRTISVCTFSLRPKMLPFGAIINLVWHDPTETGSNEHWALC